MPRAWPIIAIVTLALVIYAAWGSLPEDSAASTLPYSEVYDLAQKEQISSVEITGEAVKGKLTEPISRNGTEVEHFTTVVPPNDDELLSLLRESDATITVHPEQTSGWLAILGGLLPWLLIIGVWMWMARRARGMMDMGARGILARTPKRIDPDRKVRTTFADVAGCSAAKRDLREVIQFLDDPTEFRRLAAEVPRGILLAGPPGTGKTLLARAVAGEAHVPFYSISAAEFIELFVGMGARRVRELFEDAKRHAPSIVFIDEIDAVGRSRGTGLGGGHDEREQTLNQLLSELDGFERNDSVIVLAATNRPDVLDPALLRPGRFDRRVMVDRPEREARQAILRVHTRNKPLTNDVDLARLASITPGFTGAELESLANEAALNAVHRGADRIGPGDFDHAFDKIVLGNPRDGKLEPGETRRIAVHEAGHALVAHRSPHAEPLYRVSIIPRGFSLGATQQVPEGDHLLMTQPELEARLCVFMGGLAAERTVFGTTSTGAKDDLEKATDLATRMVAQYGMSDDLGPAHHDFRSEHPFLGQRIGTDSGTSDATIHAIEEDTRRLLRKALDEASRIIRDHRDRLDTLVETLLERESLERDELTELLGDLERAPDLRAL